MSETTIEEGIYLQNLYFMIFNSYLLNKKNGNRGKMNMVNNTVVKMIMMKEKRFGLKNTTT